MLLWFKSGNVERSTGVKIQQSSIQQVRRIRFFKCFFYFNIFLRKIDKE